MKPTLLTTAACLLSCSTFAIDLEGTAFAKAGEKYGIDPLLIYSIALAESAHGDKERTGIKPHKYAMRTKGKAYYADSKEEALVRLEELQQSYGKKSKKIDVGVMQVNLYWGAKYYESVEDLLDTEKNIMTGAAILADALVSTPDFTLGIGRYHTWEDVPRAINYGQRVLAIHRNLVSMTLIQ